MRRLGRERGDMDTVPETIGMLAGNGAYPRIFADNARAAGVRRLVAAAFVGETEAGLQEQVDVLEWLRVGQLSRLIRLFRREGVERAVMVGQIAPRNLFDLRPDVRTLKLLYRVRERNAESLFAAIAAELSEEGIELLAATTFLEHLLAPEGPLFGPALTERQLADAAYGFRIAKEMSRLDIGQTVVVRNGTVLAVEALEGTNEAIRRGGALGKGQAIAVKVSKPKQDLRFDVPVAGPGTVEAAAQSGIAGIVVEAGRTLLLEGEKVGRLCQEKAIAMHGWGGAKDE